ncbi:hypothetical protein KU43P_12740 [Pseudomonas sp. KU43P]|nr:hypothetical protein KU43P_12740 [Pseudomonas sp. KU43P]
MNRLIAEQGHAQHQPKHLIAWQAPPPDGGLRREVKRTGNPLNRDILGEGAKVGEIEEIAEIEQLLLIGHKKSDTRGLVSDSLETPAWTQMLK